VRAVGLYSFGDPDVLRVVELEAPTPGPGQVRVQVAAATINPTDVLFRSGATGVDLSRHRPPFVLGMEFAGIVDAVGRDSQRSLGDTVIAITGPRPIGYGAQAESVVVESASAVTAPAGLSLIEAATLPMNGLTAQQALDLLALEKGQTLAVSGSAGAVGGYAIQLAVQAGLEVVAVARPGDEGVMRQLGAHHFVNTTGGVDAAIDCALIGQPMIAAIRDGGGLAVLRSDAFRSLAPERGITFSPVSVMRYRTETAKLVEISRLAAAGRLTPRIASTIRPEDAADAHRRLEAGGLRGRLVFDFRS
jgi:NADPH:quinone reductase-like Zn-dependent oxidoreductase